MMYRNPSANGVRLDRLGLTDVRAGGEDTKGAREALDRG
jgi:hypothetical protein